MTYAVSSFEQDRELIPQLKSGDPRAYHFLYTAHRAWIFAKAYSVLKDRRETEELVQDVFTEVYCSITAYEGAGSLKGWIYRMTVNKSINKLRYLKAAKRGQEVPLVPGITPDATILPDAIAFADGQASVPEIGYDDLLGLVDALPGRQRAAFVYCRLRRQSYAQAAAAMSCTEDSVRALLQRARRNIRTMAARQGWK